jgi:hypothetical protein
MSTEDTWWAREDVVCLTLTRGKPITEVLDAYGADQDGAQYLTVQHARAAFPPDAGAILRAGQLDEWTFCHESGVPEGFKPVVLARLSSGTETVLFFYADGMTNICRFADGHDAESFEPGNPLTLRVSSRYPLWEAIHGIALHPSKEEMVEGLESYLGVRINGATLSGPLITVLLPNNQRAPLDVPRPTPQAGSARRATLGRRLATLRPDDLTTPKE